MIQNVGLSGGQLSPAQLQSIIQQATQTVSSGFSGITAAQIQAIMQQANQLVQAAANNQIDGNTVSNQLTNQILQLLNMNGAGSTRAALSTRGNFNPFQGFFDQVQVRLFLFYFLSRFELNSF